MENGKLRLREANSLAGCRRRFLKHQNQTKTLNMEIKVNALLALLICATMVSVLAETAEEPRVKIGIKKRVDDCTKQTRKGDFIHVHYKGSLEDGTVFDSSLSRGVPFTFTLGTNQVIKGWEQGLMGMCEGEKRRLVIPPELCYGKSGAGKIPKNAVLHFEVELVKIEKRQEL